MMVYAGDDLGDIAALRAVREAGGCALVVDHGRETPLLLLELAGQTYAGPGELQAGWPGGDDWRLTAPAIRHSYGSASGH